MRHHCFASALQILQSSVYKLFETRSIANVVGEQQRQLDQEEFAALGWCPVNGASESVVDVF